MAYKRKIGRNKRKIYIKGHEASIAVDEGIKVIDAEVAANPGRMEHLCDKVFEAMTTLPFWKTAWVDFPGFVTYRGRTKGLWTQIRLEWSRRNPGQALDYDKSVKVTSATGRRRPGNQDGIWFVISNADQARETIEITMWDNWNRSDDDNEAFISLFAGMLSKPVLAALRAGPQFHKAHERLILAAMRLSDRIGAGKLAVPTANDGIDAIERAANLPGSPSTRMIGQLLHEQWLALQPPTLQPVP